MRPRTRWIAFAALALVEAVLWLGVYAVFIEPNTLVVRRVEVESADWHGAPLTMAVLSDTHVTGPHVDAARVGRIVQRVNALRPDIVFLLGDYVGGHAPESERSPAEQQEIAGGIATFAALNARYGAVAVIGNHDVWYNRQSVTTALQDAGVAALWNRNVVIRRSGGPIAIAGLAD
ncbi:MAG: metallophosphoesterase, partial [Burkholderiales bacterium]|nr:metallophosphoesterase [Burkholderiales bacterium]